ncbi:MAG: L-glyceraldehyde 3-phosphate reductase [Chlamydiae bacterium]|nr:L-glyceraldehyde 3-phosphate reductase [Chlamydiota bacterium]
MDYNRLGNSGLKVSEIGLGTWLTFGERFGLEDAREQMHIAFDHGVNLFDTAELYANGLAELMLGEILRGFVRSDVVVITKIFFGGDGINDMGHSAKRLREGLDNSLRRLQLDYVDIVFAHRFDVDTPMEETVAAMDLIIKQGKALYWGTSEWEKEQIEEAHKVAMQMNAAPPRVEQPQYNMLHRTKVEKDFAELAKNYGMGMTIWSPLASGFLTGKYLKSIPKESRYTKNPKFRHEDKKNDKQKVLKFMKMAKELGCSMAQLALAWCLKNKNVSSTLIGATSEKQLVENLKSVQVKKKLTSSVMEKIDQVLKS